MKTLKQLREERQAKLDEAQGLLDTAKAEKRSLSAEEKTKYDGFDHEIDELAADIARTEKAEQRSAEVAGKVKPLNSHTTAEKRDLGKFSLAKMCLDVVEGRQQTGLELEMSQEAEKEARHLGITLEGRAHIPHMLAFGSEKRDNSVTMPVQPEDGSNMVFDEQPLETLGLLRPRLAIAALGAKIITGLRGELPLPGMSQGAVATWKGEIQPLDKSNIKFGRGVMKPHRLGTYIDVSKQFLIQATPGVDALLRADLNAAMSQALDTAAIYGTGLDADHQPLGILNTPGVYILAVADANGRVPTYADIIALEASPEIINANAGNMSGYLMNSKIKGTLKNTQVVNGQALMVLMNNTELNGAKLVVSNIVTDQSRGTATNASAIVYGSDWSNVILGQWGGLDLTVDNLTLALTGQNRIIVQSWWDIAVRRPNTFSAIRGVVPSAQIAALAPQ